MFDGSGQVERVRQFQAISCPDVRRSLADRRGEREDANRRVAEKCLVTRENGGVAAAKRSDQAFCPGQVTDSKLVAAARNAATRAVMSGHQTGLRSTK